MTAHEDHADYHGRGFRLESRGVLEQQAATEPCTVMTEQQATWDAPADQHDDEVAAESDESSSTAFVAPAETSYAEQNGSARYTAFCSSSCFYLL